MSVDFLERLDVVSLYESFELGLGDPFIFGVTITATLTISMAAATTITVAEASAAFMVFATSALTSAYTSWGSVT